MRFDDRIFLHRDQVKFLRKRANLTVAQTHRAIDAFIALIAEDLASSGRCQLNGIGTISVEPQTFLNSATIINGVAQRGTQHRLMPRIRLGKKLRRYLHTAYDLAPQPPEQADQTDANDHPTEG